MKGKKLHYAFLPLLSCTYTPVENNPTPHETQLLQSIELPSLYHHPFLTVQLPEEQESVLSWDDPVVSVFMEIRTPTGTQLFCTTEEAEQFERAGGILQEAEASALLLTKGNNPLHRVCDKPGLSFYKENGGTLDEIITLLEITEDRTEQTDSLFTSWHDMVLYKIAGGDVFYAQQLSLMVNNDGSFVFRTPEDYIGAALLQRDKKMTINEIIKVHSIKDEQGKEVFSSARDLLPILASILDRNMKLDDLLAFSEIETPDGKLLFNSVPDYSRLINYIVTKEQLLHLASLKNRKGEALFPNGADAVVYAASQKGDQYLAKILRIRNKRGEDIFPSGEYIAPFALMDGDPADAQSLADLVDDTGAPLLRPYQVVRYAALGYNADSLINEGVTEKPNMLLLFAQNDWNGAFQNKDIKTKLSQLKQVYDVAIGFLAEDTFFDKIPDAFRDTQLLMIAAHGSPTQVTLGYGSDEKEYLDMTDASFCQALTYLPSDATIFLFSCSTAAGGPQASHFANYVSSCAPGKNLIASTEPFASTDFKIISLYPFQATINVEDKYPYNKNPLTGKPIKTDATYHIQPQQVIITKIE